MPELDKPLRGDMITIEGVTTDFFGQIQLNQVVSWSLESMGNPDPAAIEVTPAEVATGGARADALEAVLVVVRDVSVTSIDPLPRSGDDDPNLEFEVDGSLRVNDYLHTLEPTAAVAEDFAVLSGVLRYAHDDSKLELRDVADALSASPILQDLAPQTVYLNEGVTTSALLAATLVRPAGTAGQLTLACASAGVASCPPTAPIGVGEQVVDIELTGVSASSTPAVITVTLGPDSATSDVFVYNDLQPRSVVALSPDPLGVGPSMIEPLMVTLDIPAATTGTVVDLASPGGMATVPSTVMVQPGDLDASFDVTAGSALGTDTVQASIGPSSVDAEVIIDPSAVGIGLVFSEYAEGSFGTNKYLEIKNVDPDDVDLGLCTVSVYSNGSSTPSNTISLDPVVLAPGDVFLMCNGQSTFTTFSPCDQESGSLTFNGNDSVDLTCGATVYDVIGEIGFDPGDTWGVAPITTQDAVLQRDCTIAQGDPDGSDPFDPAEQWTAASVDDGSDLGHDSCP